MHGVICSFKCSSLIYLSCILHYEMCVYLYRWYRDILNPHPDYTEQKNISMRVSRVDCRYICMYMRRGFSRRRTEGDQTRRNERRISGRRTKGETVGGRDLITRHRSRFPECFHPPFSFLCASVHTPSCLPLALLPRRSRTPFLRLPPPQPPRTVNTGDVGPSRSIRMPLIPFRWLRPRSPINSRHRGYSDRVAKICGARGAVNKCAISLHEGLCMAHIWANIRASPLSCCREPLDHPGWYLQRKFLGICIWIYRFRLRSFKREPILTWHALIVPSPVARET